MSYPITHPILSRSREEHPLQVFQAGRERCVAPAAVHAAVRGLPVTRAAARAASAHTRLDEYRTPHTRPRRQGLHY